MDYIEDNMSLAMDVVTFIDLLILNLSTKLKVDLSTLDNTECYNVDHEGDNCNIVAGKLQKEQSGEQSLAPALLKEVTRSAYSRLRDRIIKETYIDRSKLPSLYHLTKDQPKINSSTYLGNTDTGSVSTTTAPTVATTTTTTTVGSTDTLKQIGDIINTVPKTQK